MCLQVECKWVPVMLLLLFKLQHLFSYIARLKSRKLQISWMSLCTAARVACCTTLSFHPHMESRTHRSYTTQDFWHLIRNFLMLQNTNIVILIIVRSSSDPVSGKEATFCNQTGGDVWKWRIMSMPGDMRHCGICSLPWGISLVSPDTRAGGVLLSLFPSNTLCLQTEE